MRILISVVSFILMVLLFFWMFPIFGVSLSETVGNINQNCREQLMPLFQVLVPYVLLAGAPFWIAGFLCLGIKWSRDISRTSVNTFRKRIQDE